MPMYNEKDIATNLREVVKSLERFTKDYEIILVNDGSSNNCFEEAKILESAKIRVVGYSKNNGKGHAMIYGFRFARGDFIGFVDCGRDLDPFHLKSFFEILEYKKCDVVVGSKRHPQSKIHYPLMRRFMSRVYQIINRILFKLEIRDTQVGIKLYKRKVLEKIISKVAVKRFAFDLEFLVLVNKYNFKVVEAPITMRYRFGSTINSKAVFSMLWDTAAIFYRLKILRYYDEE